MLRHVSALAVGHLQGARQFFDTCRLCVMLYVRNSTRSHFCSLQSVREHEISEIGITKYEYWLYSDTSTNEDNSFRNHIR